VEEEEEGYERCPYMAIKKNRNGKIRLNRR